LPEQDDPYVPMMTYPRQSQKDWLTKLNQETRVPTTARVREAIDLLRQKIEVKPPGLKKG
jgi:hypothetical protein